MLSKLRPLSVLALLALAGACSAEIPIWTQLEPGLEAARFDSRTGAPGRAGDVTVVRLDPGRWDLRFFFLEDSDQALRSAAQWASEHDLAAVINAGMYQADMRSHVGFCQAEGRILNRGANDYLSAYACGPVDPADPPARIFDLDETPLKVVAARYGTVLQNLRLIKRHRENRWQPAGERWPEAALAEDSGGRPLLIHCSTPLTMNAFNELILALPLDVVCAQHLEGNLPAQLHIAHPAWNAGQKEQGPAGRTLPFVLGVARRDPPLSAPPRPVR